MNPSRQQHEDEDLAGDTNQPLEGSVKPVPNLLDYTDYPTLSASLTRSNRKQKESENIADTSKAKISEPVTSDVDFDLCQLLANISLSSNQQSNGVDEKVAEEIRPFSPYLKQFMYVPDDEKTYKRKIDKKTASPNLSNETQTNASPPTAVDIEGNIYNMPSSVLNDGYGLMGLQSIFERGKRNLLSIHITGMNLYELGIDVCSADPVLPYFGGALDFNFDGNTKTSYDRLVYKLPNFVNKKLPKFNVRNMSQDLLFYIFFTNTNEVMQIKAAMELFDRGWRYHRYMKKWLQLLPNGNYDYYGSRIIGRFQIFENKDWKILVQYKVLNFNDLLERDTASDNEI
ncbi:regulator of gene activity-like [Teleopsis dalmanni]|uniref:regulator of gene activity-like n=1 Tax=Teleopsis dalmanni TaxID=139649 RepID=UPI0018CDC01A|nr:regulator of gene activity-like [Teleopsis dalmanni]